MIMPPGVRKFALTAHITFSVGWIGAVVAFLALVVAAMISRDAPMLRATWIAMELIGWHIIVPLSLASLLTGLVMSLGTPWGLFRHYWIVAKLLINILSTLILLVHMQPISHLAGIAAETTFSAGEHLQLRIQMVIASAAAVLALLVATALGVYKPRGLTPYGWRKQQERRTLSQP